MRVFTKFFFPNLQLLHERTEPERDATYVII